MIKVVHFIHGLNTGGAETLVKDYISNFDRNKFDIALLCLGHEKDSPYEEELAKLGIKVIYIQDDLPFKSQNNFLKRAVNYFYRYWAVRTEILDESPDVLHTHLSINTFVKFSKPKKKTVIFHTVHNEPMILWRKNDKERLKDYGAAKWLVKHYGMRFIVLHDEMRKEVNRMLGVRNSVVLNNGINVEKFKNTKSKRQIREELKIPQNAFVVGHIGRFSEQKNHVFLVQVFTEILKKNKEVFLLIVGDGEDKSKIVKKLEDAGLNGRYLILSNRDDIPNLLNAMDVFVFPSKYEGLGMALVEAQEARLPCFVSDRVPEYATISNLVTRLPLENGAKKWADAIMNYKKPKKVIVDDENWDIKKITKQLEQLYLDALAENQNGKNRTKNTTRNIGAGLVNQIISIILPFINRTAILWILGAEFTGLAGLFSSILNVLNMAELGFNTAIVYSLYKPMADRNHKKICEIVSLFRKIYGVVGTVILIGGLCIMPFLPYFIHGSYPDTINLYIVFSLYLINAAISYYMFAYKECLLVADQRQDVSKNIRTGVNIVRYLAQLLVLLITKDFYAYLIVAIVGTVITNLLIHISTKKRYPFYKDISIKLRIPAELKKQVGGLVINKICDTFRNSFDSLIISMFIGLMATAIYGNYYYIYSALYGIMLVIVNAMSASVGNSIVKNSQETNYRHLLSFSQIFAGIMGFCTVGLACFYQPFMTAWAGEDLLLPVFDMFLFCVYFYVINMNNIRNQYISGTGMWWKLKWSYVIEAVANLILNFVLGKLFGITGVIVATIITIFLFNYLQRNMILFKNYFRGQSILKFYKQQFYYLALTAVGLVVSYLVCISLPFDGVANIVARGAICLIVPNVIYLVGVRFTEPYNDAKKFVMRAGRVVLRRG